MEQYWKYLDRMMPSLEEDQGEPWQSIVCWDRNDDWYDMCPLNEEDPDFGHYDYNEYDMAEDLSRHDHAIEDGLGAGAYYDNFGNEVLEDDWTDEIPREDDWFDDFTQEAGCPHPLLDINEKEMSALMRRCKTLPQKENQSTPKPAAAAAVARLYPSCLAQPEVCMQVGRKAVLEKEQPQRDSQEDVHPIEYRNVIQNYNKIVIQSLENAIRAIRTFKNHTLLCDECKASNNYHSIVVKEEVKTLFKELEPLLNTIKES
ncbi:uncharacterized protein FA14DRAFT_93309 [Meira miltonrushii]|uniref:Uncharacterized protein n=1 Tax=Meira miltonrushii TaxID=1280837 RepID=A0A316V2M8_9BASI|nr:uncharacterized protein FA14DRAFT_93309 [Meira miltonrushii]PWN31817.1 hypothetical protein FA14DRAFT_93309 [Meira miltonrushii]